MDKGKGAGDVASPIADLALAEYHQYGHLKAVVCSKRVNKRNEHYIWLKRRGQQHDTYLEFFSVLPCLGPTGFSCALKRWDRAFNNFCNRAVNIKRCIWHCQLCLLVVLNIIKTWTISTTIVSLIPRSYCDNFRLSFIIILSFLISCFQPNALPVYYIFSYSSTCFESYCAHHQEDLLYIYTASGSLYVTLLRWPLSAQAVRGHIKNQMLCIYNRSSWWWAQYGSKHVEEYEKI